MGKLFAPFLLSISAVLLLSLPCLADAAKEKAFVDTYKKAFEAKDETTLKSLLYTKGADPEILEFYTMMMTGEMGSKISSIELRDLTPDEVKKASEMQPLPSGEMAKLPFTPTKKLVLKVDASDAGGTGTSTSQSFVGLIDGKYMIPVPGPAKK
ncbi:MAG: hypothetical protein DCC75_06310 [Proteobacteria bacterium]|nr:MAG: hypothetical protein DCC75_06310 [Pseudomonadota bacterium]